MFICEKIKALQYIDFVQRVGIEHTQGDGPGAYISATSMSTPKKTIPESSGESHDESIDHPASDSDSSD
jgi:hypothetical protein